MCMSVRFSTIKEALLKQDTRISVAETLEKLEKLLGGVPIYICGDTKQKVRSKYQEFTAECMKAGESMQKCAEQWRIKKNGG